MFRYPSQSAAAPPPPDWRYRLVGTFLTPVILLVSAYQAYRCGQLRYLTERFGMGTNAGTVKPVWIHAASVGEVNALQPLVKGIQSACPDLPILMTTITPTGAEAVQRLGAQIHHRYLPWDSNGSVRRFIRRYRPRCAVIMETELWPNLYHQCASLNIPPLIVNGRLSAKTMESSAWLRRTYAVTLENCAAILARSATDAERFVALGARPEKVRTLGNIKHAPSFDIGALEGLPPLPRPYLLAASTHDDEELRIAEAWMQSSRADHLLVIAPRHPRRAPQIVKQLTNLTQHVAVRSRREAITADTAIHLADTLGEMPWLMQHAKLVFMGGSLVPHGGHNLLEPAQLGKAILTGPHTDNFTEERALLEHADALLSVSNEQTLIAAAHELVGDTHRRLTMEKNARDAVSAFEGVAEKYVDEVLAHCNRDHREI